MYVRNGEENPAVVIKVTLQLIWYGTRPETPVVCVGQNDTLCSGRNRPNVLGPGIIEKVRTCMFLSGKLELSWFFRPAVHSAQCKSQTRFPHEYAGVGEAPDSNVAVSPRLALVSSSYRMAFMIVNGMVLCNTCLDLFIER